MTLEERIRKTIGILKTPIWIYFPTLSIWFYRKRRLRHSSIVLLIHEGLGDLVTMAAAIKEASNEHERVYVATPKEHFDTIALIFQFKDNVKNIHVREGKSKGYKISKNQIRELGKYGYVIKVGIYDRDPVFSYPDSFYLKLGYPTSLATKKIPYDYLKYPNPRFEEFLASLEKKFIFYSNDTSDGSLMTTLFDRIDPQFNIVSFTRDENILRNKRCHDISQFEKNNFTRSLLNSLYACYLAEYVIISDAGLFNILIRLENNIDIRVVWRQYSHSLNKDIYGKYKKEF